MNENLDRCPHCTMLFMNSAAIAAHVAANHSPAARARPPAEREASSGTDLVKCPHCTVLFMNQDAVEPHVREHHPDVAPPAERPVADTRRRSPRRARPDARVEGLASEDFNGEGSDTEDPGVEASETEDPAEGVEAEEHGVDASDVEDSGFADVEVDELVFDAPADSDRPKPTPPPLPPLTPGGVFNPGAPTSPTTLAAELEDAH